MYIKIFKGKVWFAKFFIESKMKLCSQITLGEMVWMYRHCFEIKKKSNLNPII